MAAQWSSTVHTISHLGWIGGRPQMSTCRRWLDCSQAQVVVAPCGGSPSLPNPYPSPSPNKLTYFLLLNFSSYQCFCFVLPFSCWQLPFHLSAQATMIDLWHELPVRESNLPTFGRRRVHGKIATFIGFERFVVLLNRLAFINILAEPISTPSVLRREPFHNTLLRSSIAT